MLIRERLKYVPLEFNDCSIIGNLEHLEIWINSAVVENLWNSVLS